MKFSTWFSRHGLTPWLLLMLIPMVGPQLALNALAEDAVEATDTPAPTGKTFYVWAASDSHVPRDFHAGRESLGLAIRQSEGGPDDTPPGFPWDIMVDMGDLSSSSAPPVDEDGRILVYQYQALRKHYREDVYNVPGNHDDMYYDQGIGTWFQKWADPMGEHTEFSNVDASRRRFPVEGTWERYKFQAGNILFLMLADRNSAPSPVGRGHSTEAHLGGYPAGAVTRDTFNWWKEQVLENQDKIIITTHHHVLRGTTTRSKYGGGIGFHGASGGDVEGSGYLYFIIENDDPENFEYTTSTSEHPGPFELFLEQFQAENGKAAIDLWIGGHSHAMQPDQVHQGQGLTETRWGVTFVQASGLTVRHAGGMPVSRLLTWTDGSDRLDIAMYVHETPKDEPYELGWYAPGSRVVTLRRPFESPPADTRPPVSVEPREPFQPGPKPSVWPRDAGTLEPVPENAELSIQAIPAWQARVQDDASVSFKPSGRGLDLGYLDMEDWTDLTVTARIETDNTMQYMRVVSKDRVGEQGNFVLCFDKHDWEFRVFDDQLDNWRRAECPSTVINDGKQHHLAGVLDSRAKKVLLYVDGTLEAEAPWTAATLDDSDKTELVIGAESRGPGNQHVFQGRISDVRILRRAMTAEEIRELHSTFLVDEGSR